MPLTASGQKVLQNFKEQYGSEEGERNFYASLNKGVLPASLHQDAEGSTAVPTVQPAPAPPIPIQRDQAVVGGQPKSKVESYEYKQAGPPGMTIADIQAKNREYWAKDWTGGNRRQP